MHVDLHLPRLISAFGHPLTSPPLHVERKTRRAGIIGTASVRAEDIVEKHVPLPVAQLDRGRRAVNPNPRLLAGAPEINHHSKPLRVSRRQPLKGTTRSRPDHCRATM